MVSIEEEKEDEQNMEGEDKPVKLQAAQPASGEETYALKVINKSVLHPIEINSIKDESKIM